ncbi:hypothetical protein V8F06_003305 [Rhypophila decipiens]
MDSQLFPGHPLSAKRTGFSAQDYLSSGDIDPRQVLFHEFQKAVTFLEASTGRVENLTRELTSTRDFILRRVALNRGKTMEWVTTESLKISFVMWSFTQVLGFAVLLLLPPIFISTFLGSSIFVFDIEMGEQGSVPSWEVSKQGLVLWLSTALPITAIFLVVLYCIYWRSSGIRNPVDYVVALGGVLRAGYSEGMRALFGLWRGSKNSKETV